MEHTKARTLLMELLSLNPLFHRTVIRPMETSGISDLTPTQMRSLYALAIQDHVPMGSLAANMNISKQQLTKVIDTLVEKNYVERAVHTSNRRQVMVQLSEKGATLVNHVLDAIADTLEPSFEKFTQQEKDEFYNATLTIKRLLSRIQYDVE
jgi:Transcriptional regulators